MASKEGMVFPFHFHLMPLPYKSVSAFVKLDNGKALLKCIEFIWCVLLVDFVSKHHHCKYYALM